MLTELCQELRNWFDRDKPKWTGEITISNDVLYLGDTEIELLDGQYFRIIGSLLNDGVYQYPNARLSDEVFNGSVWSMGIPPSVVELADEITQWMTDNAAAINNPYASESFGGYSYSLKGNGGSSSSASSNPTNWKSFFADRLNRWRKL